MDKYKSSRVKENHILDLLLKDEPFLDGKIFLVFDENGKETFQSKNYNGEWFSYPDIEISKKQDVLVLVEVKGLMGFPTDLPFDDIQEVLPIRKGQFLSYLRVQKEEEIPLKVIFVLGFDDGYYEYKYYWEDICEMSKIPKRDLYWDKKGYRCQTLFFRASDFRRDVGSMLLEY